MAKRFKLNEGDIFQIPLGNEEWGVGQIVCFPRTRDAFIMIVFDYKMYDSTSNIIENAIESPILLLGYSTDAKLYHKHWQIIGNDKRLISKVEMPFHRLGTPPEDIFLTNYKNERLKPINEPEFNKLDYLTNYAPVRFENALKAHFGLQEWISEDYDKILYEKTLESVKIAEEILNN